MLKTGIFAACLMSCAALAGVAIYEDGEWQSGFPGSQGYRVYADGVFQDPDAVAAASASITDVAYYLFASATTSQTDSSSVGTNVLTLFNTPTHTAASGTIDAYYIFASASSEYGENVTFGSAPSAYPIRIEAWVKTDTASGTIASMQYGAGAGGATIDPVFVAGIPVPEPASFVLTMVGGLAVLRRRR